MDRPGITSNKYSPPRQWWKKIGTRWLGLTHRPEVKIYRGFGGDGRLTVFGHVLDQGPLPRRKYRNSIWTNTFSLLRLFMVRPLGGVRVKLRFDGQEWEQTAEEDGFFRFLWEPRAMPAPGWHQVEVFLAEEEITARFGEIAGTGKLYVPDSNQYAIISDIDDTFLISHSSNLRKRLLVLITKNATTRRPFDGVVKHYQLLARAGTSGPEANPFFYVSSSEWNLYDYIKEFSSHNGLPDGIYLLSQLKRLKEAWKTGQNRHATKFMRITRVLEMYPRTQFILLGDDSQQDPVIYAAVAEHFGKRIRAVYLRHVISRNRAVVEDAVSRMTALGIPVCHFRHSEDAILHSIRIGLVPE